MPMEYSLFFQRLFSVHLFCGWALFVFPGLVHVGDELREVNGNLITHKRPDEISQILVGENRFFRSEAVDGDGAFLSLYSVAVARLHHAENYSSCCR